MRLELEVPARPVACVEVVALLMGFARRVDEVVEEELETVGEHHRFALRGGELGLDQLGAGP
jgi:hypothetical protein